MIRTATSPGPKIEALMSLFRALSSAADPVEATKIVQRHFANDSRGMTGLIAISARGLAPGEYKITRAWLDGALERDARDPWRDWETMPTHRGGFLGTVVASDTPELITNLAVLGDPVLGDAIEGFGSCLVIPTFTDGELVNWTVFLHRARDGFTRRDLELHVLTANLVGSVVRRLAVARDVKALNAALIAQFEQVARVQQSLLPERSPAVPGLRVATSYFTSDQAGGDYYDFFELPEGRLGILIADVSGHGAGAATVMAMLHAILHSYPDVGAGPANVLRHANTRLTAARLEGAFVTALFAVYDPARRTLRYSRAGHTVPRLKDGATGDVRPLEGAAHFPLGVSRDFDIDEAVVQLRPLDTVVFYTDGITEAFSPGGKMFGVQGLDAALALCSGEPDCAVDTVHSALYRHTGSRTRADDQALIVMRVDPSYRP